MEFFSRRRKKRKELLWEKYSQLFREQNFQKALNIIEQLIVLDPMICLDQ